MSKTFLIASLFFFSVQPIFSQDAEGVTEAEDCIKSFFEAFHAQDTTLMKAFIHDDMNLATIKSDATDTSLVVEDVQDFLISIGSIPASVNFEEELTKIKVRTDGLIAHVWTEYTFRINNEVSHKGVNAFTLLNEGGTWRITYLVDTRRKV